MADNVFREVTSNNTPHVLIVRNMDELIDQSICQYGNTLAYFGGGYGLDKLIEATTKNWQKKISPALKPLFNLGKSLAIFGFVASTVLAMPFLRNYVTTKRTGTLQYADMIGESDKKANDPQRLEKELQRNWHKFWKTLGIGTSLAAGFMALTKLATSTLKKAPAAVQWLNQHLGLKAGKFMNFVPKQAVLFWTIPTFSGFLAAARDKYEVKEIGLRFGAFVFAFFIFPHTVEKAIDKATKKVKPPKWVGPQANLGYIAKLISSIIFCSAIPTVVNIYLTRQRVKRDAAKGSEANAALAQLPDWANQYKQVLLQQRARALGLS